MELKSTSQSAPNWDDIFKLWEQSGLSQTEFCKQHQIEYRSFLYRRHECKNLKTAKSPTKIEPSSPSPGAGFIKMEASPPKPKPSFIELQLPHGIILRIPA